MTFWFLSPFISKLPIHLYNKRIFLQWRKLFTLQSNINLCLKTRNVVIIYLQGNVAYGILVPSFDTKIKTHLLLPSVL